MSIVIKQHRSDQQPKPNENENDEIINKCVDAMKDTQQTIFNSFSYSAISLTKTNKIRKRDYGISYLTKIA